MIQIPSSNKDLIFHLNLFADNQWQEAVFEKCIKSEVKKLVETVSNFFNSIFRAKQVVLLFSGINVQWPKEISRQVLEKSELYRFKKC